MVALKKDLLELTSEIVLFHIVPRLPVKSILRFHCVCKQWCSFLKTPLFAKIHLRHAKRYKHLLLSNKDHYRQILFSTTPPTCNFHTIDCEAPQEGLTPSRSLPFVLNSKRMSIIGSLNGLLCVDIGKSNLIIWNPLTAEYKRLPNLNDDAECFDEISALGFYYTCDDDYKLLHLTCDRNAFTYSLKSDSWRKVNSTLDFQLGLQVCSELYPVQCIILNERLYFLRQLEQSTESMEPISYLIIMFDLKTEKFKEIATPYYGDKFIRCLGFEVSRGCIQLRTRHTIRNGGRAIRFAIDVWRMEGNGNTEWKKMVTYYACPGINWLNWPLHVINDEIWLMETMDDQLYKVDFKKRQKQMVCSYTDMDIPYGAKYIQTFVSPNDFSIYKQNHSLKLY